MVLPIYLESWNSSRKLILFKVSRIVVLEDLRKPKKKGVAGRFSELFSPSKDLVLYRF